MRSRIAPTLGEKLLARLTAPDVVDWFAGMGAAAGTRNRALAVLSGMLAHAETLGLRRPGSIPCKGLRRRKSSFSARYLTAKEYAQLGAALPGAASTSNRALAVLSGLCRHAELVGERPPGSNPCAGMRRRKSGFKARYLSDKEWGRLGRALRELELRRPELAALIRFIALTGCRAGEARALQWDWIEGGRAALRDSKSGPKTIWLGAAVRSLLAERPQTCPWVFARRELPIREGAPWNAWDDVRKHARLDDVRLHGLRHSFASVAVSSGETLRVVAGLLGHTELATTEGYAHLAEAPVRAAAERMGAFFDRTLGKRRPGSVAVASSGRRAAALVALYRASKLSLRAFCAEHDLDARAFHTTLVETMAAKRKARS